jgi:type II secretory pathway component HofQ
MAQTSTTPAVVGNPVPPPGNGQRLISLDFKDADVVNLLRILAAESGRNIVIGEDVKGKMSISLRNVPWELALETILESRGLQKVERDGVIRIVSTDQLTKEREARARVEVAKLKGEAEVRAKRAEAQLKEAEAQTRKLAARSRVPASSTARSPSLPSRSSLALPPLPARHPCPCRCRRRSLPRGSRSAPTSRPIPSSCASTRLTSTA